jgi:hypothetical protein
MPASPGQARFPDTRLPQHPGPQDTLTHLGDTRHAAGELAQARQAWQQALAVLEDLQHPEPEQVRARLSGLV